MKASATDLADEPTCHIQRLHRRKFFSSAKVGVMLMIALRGESVFGCFGMLAGDRDAADDAGDKMDTESPDEVFCSAFLDVEGATGVSSSSSSNDESEARSIELEVNDVDDDDEFIPDRLFDRLIGVEGIAGEVDDEV